MSRIVSDSIKHIARGLYRHTRTGTLYNVIGTGRLIDKPEQKVVIYTQLAESVLKDSSGNNTQMILPMGSTWVRNLEEFTDERFEKCD